MIQYNDIEWAGVVKETGNEKKKRETEHFYTTLDVCAFPAIAGSISEEEIGAVNESRRREEISMFWVELCRVMAGVGGAKVDAVPEVGTEAMGYSE